MRWYKPVCTACASDILHLLLRMFCLVVVLLYFRVGCSAKRTASRSRVPGACSAAETGSGGRMLPERVGRVVKQLRIKRRRGIRAGPGNDRQRDGNRRHGMPRCPTARHLCNCSSTSLQCMSRAANAIQLKQTTTLWTS